MLECFGSLRCKDTQVTETHMTAPQELGVFDQSLLRQLLVEQLVHFGLQTLSKLRFRAGS